MINSKFPVLELQLLQQGRANENSALVIEIFFLVCGVKSTL